MHKRLEHMKETLMCAVEMQLCDLGDVDTKELGEAIDMIKDLEEAIYYCTVTEAMNKPGSEFEMEMKNGERKQHQENGEHRMYYAGGYPMMHDQSYMYADDGRRRRADGTFYAEGGQSYNMTNGGQNYNPNNSSNYAEQSQASGGNQMYRDEREGRSYNSRRMYMEAKEMKQDKATQLRELEKYMQELSQDITEMIADASSEEKQYLEKKMTALASKIGAMK